MGDGLKLKKFLDEKGTNVRQIAKQTGISPTTLYSIIQKDSNLRFDWALRIANILEIEVDEICEANPFSGKISVDEIYPTLGEFNGILDASRVRGYLKSSILPLILIIGIISAVWKMCINMYHDKLEREVAAHE